MVYFLVFQRFNPVAVPEEKYGQFHVGDAYVVLNVSWGSCSLALWTTLHLINFTVCYLVGVFSTNNHGLVLYLFV